MKGEDRFSMLVQSLATSPVAADLFDGRYGRSVVNRVEIKCDLIEVTKVHI